MKTILVSVAVIGALVGASLARTAAGAGTAPGGGVAAAPASPADQALLSLLAEDLDAQMRADPVGATMRGDRRFDRLWPDLSPEAVAARAADSQSRLTKLGAINRATLSEENRLNADLLEHQLKDRLAQSRFKPEQIQITQQDGPQISLPQLPDSISFNTEAQLADYVTRLETIGPYMDKLIACMRAGVKEGRTPPKAVLGGVVDQVNDLLNAEFMINPTSHPMYRPFLERPEGDALAARAEAAIRGSVLPSFARMRDFLRDEYVKKARESLAATDMPDGKAFYEYLIHHYTTTDMTAQQIHDLGKSEVARIRAEMMEVIARSDFPRKSELQADVLFAAFTDYLRTDSRFYYQAPEALLTGYRDICKRMDAELPRLFGKLPRLSYGVREMPAFMSAAAPTAYYYPGSLKNGVSGTFIANTYKLEQRPKYEMTALAFHESVPGHHLQISLAKELEDAGLPEWRTTVDYTVFVEGWGLYSERLGLEVGGTTNAHGTALGPGGTGFYEDPYNEFGRLSYEMWRALRLVVDTGMHAFGWTRQQAIDYMIANSALTKQNIESEVNRYIATPGQALAYKIGQLKILELRKRAQDALGEKFDVRAFHDTVLGAGSVPLSVLERRVDEWMARSK